jgi:uncharacterized protein
MNGYSLKMYFQELRKHDDVLLYEWLLHTAKEIGIHGGSIFRGIAGFGRHGVIHEEHFFELASDVPMEAVFIGAEKEIQAFLDKVKEEGVQLFYTKEPLEFGFIDGDIKD